jgi:hypothetical protein
MRSRTPPIALAEMNERNSCYGDLDSELDRGGPDRPREEEGSVEA